MVISFPLFGFSQSFASSNLDNSGSSEIYNESPLMSEKSTIYHLSLSEGIGVTSNDKKSPTSGDTSNPQTFGENYVSKRILHKVSLTEKISLSEDEFTQNPVYDFNTKIQAITERIFERDRIPKSPISKTFSSLYLQNHQTENPIENNIKIEAATPILVSINSVNSFNIAVSQLEIISPSDHDSTTCKRRRCSPRYVCKRSASSSRNRASSTRS